MNLPINYKYASASQRVEARHKYVKQQEGLCFFCKKPLCDEPSDEVKNAHIDFRLFPKGFMIHPIHLHHNHKTGMTIGAVHARCNAYMWQYNKE